MHGRCTTPNIHALCILKVWITEKQDSETNILLPTFNELSRLLTLLAIFLLQKLTFGMNFRWAETYKTKTGTN